MESDDEHPQLSSETLLALQEFYNEQAAKLSQKGGNGNFDVDEDWQLSQFWYDDKTSEILAMKTLNVTGPFGRIACISCPSVFKKLQNLKQKEVTTHLLEYDRRFDVYTDNFIYYDFNKPLNLPKSMKENYDVVLADPPFLSKECLEKTSLTIQYLAKDKIILCTGAVMEDDARKLLDIQPCNFSPQHARNLGNEFKCFVNFDFDSIEITNGER
ncbi:EEF1A lysine methyltransferase 1-like [Limulus polyphemus]|uniref:Protein-lysine N-methyltransferase LOC106464460 n=1 Tax=Limulus polyphemus TaxID=6850 RepID=A0ABM1BDY8_LIMPO|nr:EEF1A lysine methyltransferase 1-like [Limulus polyphemus]